MFMEEWQLAQPVLITRQQLINSMNNQPGVQAGISMRRCVTVAAPHVRAQIEELHTHEASFSCRAQLRDVPRTRRGK